MKKLVYLFSLLVVVMLSAFNLSECKNQYLNPSLIEQNDSACQYGQCHAIAKSTGERCKHCVSKKGDAYCYQHK